MSWKNLRGQGKLEKKKKKCLHITILFSTQPWSWYKLAHFFPNFVVIYYWTWTHNIFMLFASFPQMKFSFVSLPGSGNCEGLIILTLCFQSENEVNVFPSWSIISVILIWCDCNISKGLLIRPKLKYKSEYAEQHSSRTRVGTHRITQS